jgi:ubiquinone/menaquinone biosynthesis C-methylase UbiE
MFSDETRRQAAVFDAIGDAYDQVFAHKDGQIEAGEWLTQRLQPGARVFDAGCGTGLPTARSLVEAGFEVVGVDISQKMLELARQNVPNARFLHLDMAALPADFVAAEPAFDAITAFFSLLMLPRARIPALLEEWAGLLNPGGYMVIAMVEADLDYVEIPFLGQSPRLTGYPRAELHGLLHKAGLDVLESRAFDFPATEKSPAETQLFYYCRRTAR